MQPQSKQPKLERQEPEMAREQQIPQINLERVEMQKATEGK
jgi:hypothetical protein